MFPVKNGMKSSYNSFVELQKKKKDSGILKAITGNGR